MKLWTKSTNKKVVAALDLAQKYLDSRDFELDVESVPQFSHTTAKTEQIIEAFRQARKRGTRVEVRTWYFGRFRKRVLGVFTSGNFVSLNTSGLLRKMEAIAATIVHEVGHWVDWLDVTIYFGHGDNSSVGKEMTFPYWIGKKAQRWVEREEMRMEVERLNKRIVELTTEMTKERIAA